MSKAVIKLEALVNIIRQSESYSLGRLKGELAKKDREISTLKNSHKCTVEVLESRIEKLQQELARADNLYHLQASAIVTLEEELKKYQQPQETQKNES